MLTRHFTGAYCRALARMFRRARTGAQRAREKERKSERVLNNRFRLWCRGNAPIGVKETVTEMTWGVVATRDDKTKTENLKNASIVFCMTYTHRGALSPLSTKTLAISAIF